MSSGSVTSQSSPPCDVASETAQGMSGGLGTQGSSSSAGEREHESFFEGQESSRALTCEMGQCSLPRSKTDPGSSSVSVTSETTAVWVGYLSRLCDVLPNFSQEVLKFVYAESGENLMNTMKCSLEGPTLESIQNHLSHLRFTSY